MPFSKWQRHRFVRPIRVLSLALGLLGIMISIVLYFFITSSDPNPPIFKYAFITLSLEVWCGLFMATGVITLLANILHRGAHVAHSFGVLVWTWWALILTLATIDPGVATSGYSFLCGIAALAYWVCSAYWEAENPHVLWEKPHVE